MENKQNMLQKKQLWSTQMAKGTITNPDISGLEVEVEEEVVENEERMVNEDDIIEEIMSDF